MNSQERERRKIRELAREYTQKGYVVRKAPLPAQLPKSLQAYRPDLWLTKGEQHIWVEVKTSETIEQSPYLVAIAELLKELPNWELELVLTNPKKKKA
ncbi:MAG: hypothetical protein AAF694_01285 [Bacteroidota bacterium]